ncbi:MAG: flagellar hook-associated protein FlgL, partial [Pseudomonadales bacterium]
SVNFVGDEGQRFVKVSATTTLASNNSGKALFMDVPSANNTFTTQPHTQNTAQPLAAISAKAVIDQAAYDSFYPEDLRVEFNNPPTTFNIVQKSDGATLVTIQPYQSGDDIEVAGLQFSISGAPAAGDRFFIESSAKQSLFKTVGDLITGLETLDDSVASNEPRQALLAASLDNLDNAHDTMLKVRTSIGARLNVAESTAAMHEDLELLSQKVLSEERDLDYADAISRLSFQSFVLEAAQQSFARVSNLSLFNFLR